MLDFLKPLSKKEYDCIFLNPGEEDGTIRVEINKYNDPGDSVNESDLGKSYHILLYRFHEETDELIDFDNFDAVLIEPFEYLSQMIPQGWYGVVARKTTNSPKFVQEIVDKVNSVCYNS